jgi:hypothetical protein
MYDLKSLKLPIENYDPKKSKKVSDIEKDAPLNSANQSGNF